MTLWIGTSGWQYRDWRGKLYERGLPMSRWFDRYIESFDTVELNVTFYRMPAAAAFAGWRDAVPDGFVFAVKASRYLTHIKRLADPQGSVEFLMERASILGDRLGPILVQLPPTLEADFDRLERTLEAFGPNVQVVVEPRHASWFTAEADRTLVALRVSRAAADPALCDAAAEPGGWLGEAGDGRGARLYYRWHGSPRIYYSNYDESSLAALATRLLAAARRGADVWCIFDNTAAGAALANALSLGSML